MSITQEQRADLKVELDAIAEAQAPIMKLMEPLREAIACMEQMVDIVLLRYGIAERPETCEGCEAFIIAGDMHCSTADAGLLCETCAPTYSDLREQADSFEKDEDHTDTEHRLAQMQKVRDHLAGGGALTDKLVHEYQP